MFCIVCKKIVYKLFPLSNIDKVTRYSQVRCITEKFLTGIQNDCMLSFEAYRGWWYNLDNANFLMKDIILIYINYIKLNIIVY